MVSNLGSRKIIILILCFLFPPIIGWSQDDGKWVSCSGEALVQNISNEEAQVIALRQARLHAIEKVCGVSLQAETLIKNFTIAGDFIHSISYGHVVNEKEIQWKTESIPSDEPGAPPIIKLIVNMQAKVIPEKGTPDSYFKVELKLNRHIFQSGEEVILNVKTTKDCYLTVLNLAANDSVYVLFPNKWQKDNFINANTRIDIPNEQYRETGLHFRVANLLGHKKDTELVKIIATKQKIYFLDEIDDSSGFGMMGTPKMAVIKLTQCLSEIPLSERAEATVIYTVQSKN